MTLEVSTPALLFPAISLLFLSYTNRFLHLSALIRTLHGDWVSKRDCVLKLQIDNLGRRLVLIRAMQLLGAISLLLCVTSMVGVISESQRTGVIAFGFALLLMGASLVCLVWEIWISGGALRIMLAAVEGGERRGDD
jgi:dipeptide/tripeptide permease